MPKVYVTNLAGYDYSPAEIYGDMIYMSRGYIKPQDLNKQIIKVQAIISESERDDFLLLSGNNLICALALQHWMTIHNACQIIHWDSENKKYLRMDI